MEIGSHSTPIYNALITQNKYKLNDILGINDKTTQLSDNQTAQLKRVADEIISREDNYRTELAKHVFRLRQERDKLKIMEQPVVFKELRVYAG